MSSFTRKSGRQSSIPIGSRSSPSSSSTLVTSTGILSLDELFGGGLPLSCSLLVLAPDPHSAYGELLQKYFIAQGLACGQDVCIIDDRALDLVNDCMWTQASGIQVQPSRPDELGDENESQSKDKIKIAWRYEQMKKFQTTAVHSTPFDEEYCRTFDLTCRIPKPVIEDALQTKKLSFVTVSSSGSMQSAPRRVLAQLANLLESRQSGSTTPRPLRLCIPSLGSPNWGDINPVDILHFVYSIRSLLRKYPHVCASLCLLPHMCTDAWGGTGWVEKLGWLSDAAIILSAFTANPSLAAAFPSHHGFLRILTMPAVNTLVPPSEKFSALRGLSSTAGAGSGSGENNLAFICTRKRLIFETLHLDLDGGVGERRTTPSINDTASGTGVAKPETHTPQAGLATVEIGLEDLKEHVSSGLDVGAESTMQDAVLKKPKVKKPKKTVAFMSDRPDLYDF